MSFLTPLSALLAAAVAIPLLVLLYLLKLRRQPVRIPSTLLWKQTFQDLQANVPFQKLRYTPLLLIQLLLLIALLLALAQPMIEGDVAPASRMILLIDTSASMQSTDIDSKDNSRTRLDAALDEARDLIDAASRADTPSQIMIVAFGSSPRIITSFESNRAILLDSLNRLEPTDETAELQQALELAGAFASRSEDSENAPDIILFSDGGVGSPPSAGGFKLRAGQFQFLQIAPPPKTPIDNLGITAFTARRNYDNPAQVDVFARLTNTNLAPVELIATITAQTVDADTSALPLMLTVPAATSDSSVPGQRSFTATLELPGDALLTLRHNHTDSLAADDVASLILPAPRAPRIAVVHPDSTETTDGADEFLIDLLRATNPRRLSVLSEAQYNSIDSGEINSGTHFDFLVFDRVTVPQLPAIPTLTFGATQPPFTAIESSSTGGNAVLSWDRSHALMQHVELDPLRYSGFGAFVLPEGATPLAWGNDGPIIALVRINNISHINVGFALRRSNWPLHISIAVFIQNVLDQLTEGGLMEAIGYLPGATITAAPIAGERILRITGPMTAEIPIQDSTPVTLPPFRRTGMYTILNSQLPLNTIPISMLSDLESDIRPRNTVEVNAESAVASIGTSGTDKPLWPWLVAAAVMLAVIEWLAWCARARV